MQKCNKCGCEFEGDSCPNCGAALTTDSTPPEVTAENAPSEVIPRKRHLKIIIPAVALLLVAIILLACIPTFITASVNGTYYHYSPNTETFYEKDHYTLNTGMCKSSDGVHGTYTVGSTATFRLWFLDIELEPCTATIKNGVLLFEDSGIHKDHFVYVSKNHKHSYGKWVDEDELPDAQSKTQVRTCLCGKKESRVVTKAQGRQTKIQPNAWISIWNSSNRPVVWEYKGE